MNYFQAIDKVSAPKRVSKPERVSKRKAKTTTRLERRKALASELKVHYAGMSERELLAIKAIREAK